MKTKIGLLSVWDWHTFNAVSSHPIIRIPIELFMSFSIFFLFLMGSMLGWVTFIYCMNFYVFVKDPLDSLSKIFSAIQWYSSWVSVGLLLYDSKSTLGNTTGSHKKSERVRKRWSNTSLLINHNIETYADNCNVSDFTGKSLTHNKEQWLLKDI